MMPLGGLGKSYPIVIISPRGKLLAGSVGVGRRGARGLVVSL